ncbi:MAG: nucleoside deaminase [Alphaproteobacteria bacterium]|nr:nucleoside deaminase [Alphaproteobacteria bacterium]QQS58505.1 MAG: nucleoside deaminase [Alphaproteobacteria bacterium]
MQAAMEEAKKAAERDEVPVGAVIVDNNTKTITARAGNRTIAESDPTAHAEVLVIREMCRKIGVQRLPDYDLYVTLEPCAMCAAAISFARIGRVTFAATDPKGGGIIHGAKFYEQPTCHHRPKTAHGLLQEESGKLLKDFFRSKRDKT